MTALIVDTKNENGLYLTDGYLITGYSMVTFKLINTGILAFLCYLRAASANPEYLVVRPLSGESDSEYINAFIEYETNI